MKRSSNFSDLLDIARNQPDVIGAMSRLGIQLKQVGGSRGKTRYQTTTDTHKEGDLSSVVFMKNPDGSWVIFDNKERTGKGALDAISAVQAFGGVSFDDAVYMLSSGSPDSPIISTRPAPSQASNEPIEPFEFRETPAFPEKTKNVIAYLTKTRKIPAQLVNALLKSDKLYAGYVEAKKDKHKIPVCAFRILDENGKPVGTDACAPSSELKFKHVAEGSDPNYAWCFLWGVDSVTADTDLYFCESPIDAMSLCALAGTPGAYISLCGVKDITFQSMCNKLGGTPIICVDNDDGGNRFAAKHSDCARFIPPHGKDWNDTLKHYVEAGKSYALQPKARTDRSPKKAESVPDKGTLEVASFEQQLNDWFEGNGKAYGTYNGQYFNLGITPDVMLKYNAKALPLIMYDDCLLKITGGKHSIALTELAKLPDELTDPILLFKGSVPDSFVALTNMEMKNGHNAVVAVHLNKHYKRLEVNKIASIYSKTNELSESDTTNNYISKNIQNGNLLCASKTKAPIWFTNRGLQLPKLVQTIIDADNSIPQDLQIVNKNEKEILKDETKGSSMGEQISRMPDASTLEVASFGEKSFSEQIDAVLSGTDMSSTHLKVMQTPKLLQEAGLSDLPILITAKHLKSIISATGFGDVNYHDLGVEIVKRLPEYLSHPVIVADSLTKNDSIVVITEAVDKQDNPVIAAIMLDGKGRIDKRFINANILTSAYGKDGFQSFVNRLVNKNAIIYWNKEKSQRLSVNLGVQFPDIMTSLSSDIIIRKTTAFVNKNNENILSDNAKIFPKEEKMPKTNKKLQTEPPIAERPAPSDNRADLQKEIRSELKQRVSAAVEAYRSNPRKLAEFLSFAARFNNYSGHNLRLIWAQRPTAQFVAAASYFKAGMPGENGEPLTNKKIMINKGEKALRIWKPYEETLVYVPGDNESLIPTRYNHLSADMRARAASEGWKQEKRVNFTLVPVFDITQTNAPPEAYPKSFGFGGDRNIDADKQFKAVKNYAQWALNCPVRISDLGELKASVRGLFSPEENKIEISDMLSGDGKLSTLLHEIGHAELHRDRSNKSTAQKELEADMYSLLLESRLGIESTEARCDHLGAHYEAYLQEQREKLPQGRELDLNSDIEPLNNALRRYYEQAPIIEEYIDLHDSIHRQLGRTALQPDKIEVHSVISAIKV